MIAALLVVKFLLGAWLLYRWRRNRRPRVEGPLLPPQTYDAERAREWTRAQMRDV